MQTAILIILFVIQLLVNILFIFEYNRAAKEAMYYKQLFKKMLNKSRALEMFIMAKINNHLKVEQ